MSSVAIIVTLRVKPGCEAEYLRLLYPVLDAMRHETTFINAVLHRDPKDPSLFMVYETWADLEDVETVQRHRPYRAEYFARLEELLTEPPHFAFWHPMRGDFGFFAPKTPPAR
jgi:quinol monooxygenase YgiN